MRRFTPTLLTLMLTLPVHLSVQAASSKQEQARQTTFSDLIQLYRQSLEQDPRILAAGASARRAEYRQREALGQLLPQINAESTLTSTDYSSKYTDANYNGERYAVAMNQVLYEPTVWQSYQRSRSLTQQYAAQGQVDIQGAAVDLVQKYFEVLAAQDSLELTRAEKRVVERNLARIRSLYQRQLVPITDKLDVEARYDRLKSDEIEAWNAMWVARESLAELVGRPIYEQLKRIDDKSRVTQQFDLKSQDYWQDQALSNNPLIQAKLAAVEAQRAQNKQARAGHQPSFNLQLSSQKSNIGYENSLSSRTESNVAALRIKIPIYSGGSTSARSDAEYEGLVVTQQELEAARRQVLKEVRIAAMNTESYGLKIQAAETALKSSSKALEAAETNYRYGVKIIVDILDRAREKYSAQRDLMQAKYSFLLSYVILKRWTGTLSEEDIVEVNKLLRTSKTRYLPAS